MAFLLLLASCAQVPLAELAPPLILISVDGFRPDYLNQDGARNLRALAAQGVRAEAMHPSFPSITFPNHYTIVTGLRPDHHGIVDNTMEDPALPGERFSLSNQKAVIDHRWWDQAEPVWVTAEKQQVRTAIMYWPGSEAAIHGVLPSNYRPFDTKVIANDRVDVVLGWLDLPVASRPRMLAMYFDDVDHAGHAFGPASAQVADSVARVDAALGRLTDGLRARGIAANIVIVSDHGMAATSAQRLIRFNRIAPAGSYRLITAGPNAGIQALPGEEPALAAALLKPQEHMQCWRKGEIPARFHYGQNARVPPFVCSADVGWFIVPGGEADKFPQGGTHGYDNLSPEMQAVFIAAGPAFRQGVVLPAFDNVDVYPLLMKLINVPALPSDGTLAPLTPGLKTVSPRS
ncbi:MAG: ectonucleotide pyrophosphatase/phosphodiesterase [Pseudomonadota bacterium]